MFFWKSFNIHVIVLELHLWKWNTLLCGYCGTLHRKLPHRGCGRLLKLVLFLHDIHYKIFGSVQSQSTKEKQWKKSLGIWEEKSCHSKEKFDSWDWKTYLIIRRLLGLHLHNFSTSCSCDLNPNTSRFLVSSERTRSLLFCFQSIKVFRRFLLHLQSVLHDF